MRVGIDSERRRRAVEPWGLALLAAFYTVGTWLLEGLADRWPPPARWALLAAIALTLAVATLRTYRWLLQRLVARTGTLRERETQLAEAQRIAHLGSWELDLATQVLTWSDEQYRILGLEPGEGSVSLEVWLARVHPEDRNAIAAGLQDAIDRRGSCSREVRIVRPDGRTRWIQSRGAFVAGANAGPGRMVGTAQDVTERVEAEELARHDEAARQRAEATLLESEERLRLALEVAGLGTWDADLRSGTVVWSEVKERMLGFQPGGFSGKQAQFEALLHPDDRERVLGLIGESIATANELRVEYRMVCPDGVVRTLTTSGRAFYDEAGPRRMLGVTRDVTELRAAEQQRELLTRGEKLRALGQMASGIAHDLNQQFGLVSGYGELAERVLGEKGLVLPEVAEPLRIIVQAAIDGGETVKRLLTFACAPVAGKPQPVNVGALLHDVAQLTAPRWRDATQAQGNPIALQVEAAPDLVVQGWPHALREAITNLIFNAVDAMPQGGTIRLAAETRNGHVRIEVTDSGTGMPPDVQSRLFEPFFTTKGERGSGLGLAGVYGIVESHGGNVEVRSAVGKGSTFCLALPRARRSVVETASQASRAPARAGLRVLAVEDEPGLRTMVAHIVEGLGCSVVTAASGEEAIAHLAADPRFDVLLSDLGLGPGINGWELASQVAHSWPRLKVVLVTGWGAEIDATEAAARGVSEVLAKPYRIQDLQRVLATA